MQNRRQQYRHEFPPTRPMMVHLHSPHSRETITAEVVNLSIGGMCVYSSALRKHSADRWDVALTFDSESEPLTVPAETVYRRPDDSALWGFRFAAETDEEKSDLRERVIWQFLLSEQRRRARWIG